MKNGNYETSSYLAIYVYGLPLNLGSEGQRI